MLFQRVNQVIINSGIGFLPDFGALAWDREEAINAGQGCASGSPKGRKTFRSVMDRAWWALPGGNSCPVSSLCSRQNWCQQVETDFIESCDGLRHGGTPRHHRYTFPGTVTGEFLAQFEGRRSQSGLDEDRGVCTLQRLLLDDELHQKQSRAGLELVAKVFSSKDICARLEQLIGSL